MSQAKYLPSKNRGIPVPKEPKTIGEHLRRRRLKLGLRQSEVARKLGISTVTLSRWECDKVYPTWPQQPTIALYLGYDPFTDSSLGAPKSNETSVVAILSSNHSISIGQQIRKWRMELKKTRKKLAQELGISVKTLWGWETDRRQSGSSIRLRVAGHFKIDPTTLKPLGQPSIR